MTTINSSPNTDETLEWTSRQPTNLNQLRTNGFLFRVQALPQVSYWAQSVNIPSVTLGIAEQATPLIDIKHPGEKLVFSELSLSYAVSEDMANFIELHKWMYGLGRPISSDQFVEYVASHSSTFPNDPRFTEGPQLSDATLLVLDANNNPSAEFSFIDCFPTSMSEMSFDISSGEAAYFKSTVSFAFLYYTVRPLTNS